MITYTKAKLKKLLENQNFSAECTIHLNDRSYDVTQHIINGYLLLELQNGVQIGIVTTFHKLLKLF